MLITHEKKKSSMTKRELKFCGRKQYREQHRNPTSLEAAAQSPVVGLLNGEYSFRNCKSTVARAFGNHSGQSVTGGSIHVRRADLQPPHPLFPDFARYPFASDLTDRHRIASRSCHRAHAMASPPAAVAPTATSEEPQGTTQAIGKRKRTPEPAHEIEQQPNGVPVETEPQSLESFQELLLDIVLVLSE